MDGPPPPPPPPHGSNPKTTGGGLPPGNYDIFIIPPHSSGGGFLYLPSLQVQRNSFIAGAASALAAIAVWKMVEPTVKQGFITLNTSVSSAGSPILVLVIICAFAGWLYGQKQSDGAGGPSNGPHGGAGGAASGAGYQRARSPPNGGFPGAGAPPPQGTTGGGWQGGGYQQHGAPHDSEWFESDPTGSSWEKAREETRKREEEQEAQKKKEDADRQARAKAEKEKWEKMRQREREQREREARERIRKEKLEKEKEAREKEQREKEAREAEARAKIEKEIRDKLAAEQKAKADEEAKKRAAEEKAKAEAAAAKAKADAERAERLKAARERAQRDRDARLKAETEKLDTSAGRRSTTYGGMGGGERTDPYAGTARGPPAPSVTSTHSSPIKVNISPKKNNYEKPSAKSYIGTEDMHSFRPYDTPKRPPKPPSHYSSIYSDGSSSYAASQSTARTTPPPSQRGPYSTTDPDKIQIKAVFSFNDLFPKPVGQLVAGIGHVTDGLILKIGSEGLFIDDDIRNVPQREWDVKAWTLKLVEVSHHVFFLYSSYIPIFEPRMLVIA